MTVLGLDTCDFWFLSSTLLVPPTECNQLKSISFGILYKRIQLIRYILFEALRIKDKLLLANAAMLSNYLLYLYNKYTNTNTNTLLLYTHRLLLFCKLNCEVNCEVHFKRRAVLHTTQLNVDDCNAENVFTKHVYATGHI